LIVQNAIERKNN